jgi:hypothetical protein
MIIKKISIRAMNVLLTAEGDSKEIGNKYVNKRRALLIFSSFIGKYFRIILLII